MLAIISTHDLRSRINCNKRDFANFDHTSRTIEFRHACGQLGELVMTSDYIKRLPGSDNRLPNPMNLCGSIHDVVKDNASHLKAMCAQRIQLRYVKKADAVLKKKL